MHFNVSFIFAQSERKKRATYSEGKLIGSKLAFNDTTFTLYLQRKKLSIRNTVLNHRLTVLRRQEVTLLRI